MNNKDKIEKKVSVFASQSEAFYTNGIKKLSIRWQEVIDNEDKYIID